MIFFSIFSYFNEILLLVLGVNFGTISLFIIFMKQSVKLYNPPLNANVHFKNCN